MRRSKSKKKVLAGMGIDCLALLPHLFEKGFDRHLIFLPE